MNLVQRIGLLGAAGLAALAIACADDNKPHNTATPPNTATASASPSPPPTDSPTPYVTASPTASPVPFPDISEALEAGYTKQQIFDYFMEIAFGVEHGEPRDSILKWIGPLKIYPYFANAQDVAVLQEVIAELKVLTGLDISLVEEESKKNINVLFLPVSEFPEYSRDVSEVMYLNPRGYVNVSASDSSEIYRCQILIDSQQPDSIQSHVVREELTQCLGVLNDSFSYPGSIFNDSSNETIYAPIDVAIIKMAYWNAIRPGMSKADVESLLQIEN